MEFIELTVKKFEKFALEHEQISFHQAKEWAELKKTNGWDAHYVGVIENEKILAASLLLSKKTVIGKSIFYAPRGFLLDYHNFDLLSFFTKEVRKFVQKKGGFFVKIDPYVPYRQRDVLGNIVENGFCHDDIISSLKKLGYHHYGFHLTFTNELQPRFIFWLPVKGKTKEEVWENFSKDTKRHINRTKRELLDIEEVTLDNIDDFCGIMEHTSKRRGFIDRPRSYYERMLSVFGDNIKILSAVLYPNKALEYWNNELSKLKIEELDKKNTMQEVGSKKSKDAYKRVQEDLNSVIKTVEGLEELKKNYGERIVLASSMFLMYGKEVVYLFSGSYEEFMKYNAQYLIQWEMIQYTIEHGYERYNFYGIEGNFDDKNSEIYGVYEFKKGFDGEVVEFIGEFDLIVSKGYYYLYKMAFGLYKNLKRLKLRFKKEDK